MDVAFRSPPGPVRLAKTALGIAITAIIGSMIVGWLAYSTSRQATLDSVRRENLSVARSIVNHIEYDLASQEDRPHDRQRTFEIISEAWQRTDPQNRESYLCVIESSGKIAVHSREPEMQGTDVSSLIVDSNSAQPRTVLQLLAARESLATHNIDFQGKRQLAGYAYMPSLDSLVAVHVPARMVEAKIRNTALPWSIALALIVGLLFPLSVGLIHQNYSRAQRAVNEKSTALLQSEQQFRAMFEQAAVGVSHNDSLTGQFLEINQRFCDMMGYSHGEMTVLTYQDIIHPDDVPADLNIMAELRAGRIREFAIEKRFVRGDGTIVWASLTVSPMWQPGEKPTSHIAIVEDITDRKRVEEALLESEARYADLYENAPQMMLSIEPNTANVVQCNQTMADVLGRRKHEIKGRPIFDIIAPDSLERVRSHLLPTFVATGRIQDEELMLKCGDGTTRNVILNSTAVRDETGEIRYSRSMFKDVTEQKKAELKLAESETRLRTIFESEPECVKLIGRNGEVLEMNPAGLAIVEADSPQQVVNQSIYPIIMSEHREAFRTMNEQVFSGENVQLEFEIVGLKGTPRWMESHATPLRDAKGKIIAQLAVTRDITDRKRADRQLRITKFSVDSCSTMIFWIRGDASFSYVNDAAARHFGYSRKELLSMSVADIDPAYPKKAWPEVWDNIQRARTLTFETKLLHKNESLIPVSITTSLLEFEKQEFLFAFVTDITARKQAEARIQASEKRFRALIENSYDVINLFSANGELVYTSPSIKRVLGYDQEEMMNLHPFEVLHPDDAERSEREFRHYAERPGAVSHFVMRLKHKDGSYRTVEVTGSNLLEEPGIQAMVSIFRDISDRTVAEERLREREMQLAHVSRLSTMGEMAAGIAHEIKQPLHAVANFATASAVALRDVAGRENMDDDLVVELIDWNRGINKASLRASEIVERLRSFARKSDPSQEILSVAHLLQESVELMAFETRMNQISVDIQVPDDIPDVSCDPIQIQQVLVNLLNNAYDALSQTTERRIILSAIRLGNQVEVQLSDNGPGVPEDVSGSIFGAFFTTKQDGMGMGLAISQTIIEDHGGRLKADTNEHGGAKFYFTLPIANESNEALKEYANER